MRIRVLPCAALAAAIVATCAAPVRAQQYEAVGIRAQGMAGAFVAVADDATATWWNPAGLASGAYFDAVLENNVTQQPRERRGSDGSLSTAWQSRARGFAMAFPSGGVSYYRLQVSEIQPLSPTGGPSPSREALGTGLVRLHALVLNQFGTTVGQSLGNHLVIGSTLKLIRGSVASAHVQAADATFDRALTLERDGETHPDLDLGALAKLGVVRIGLSVKNLRAPAFGPADDRQQLKRRVRAGMAVITGLPRGANQLAIAVDADLTKTSTVLGDTQYVSAGIEAWTLKRRIGLRAGVSTNRIGERQMSPSSGVSLAVRSGLYVEGQYSAGSTITRHTWGVDARVTF